MVRSRVTIFITMAMLTLMVLILFLPKVKADWTFSNSSQSNFLHRLFYLSGPIERIGNFFLFIPIFLMLAHVFPDLRLRRVAVFSIAASGCAEIVQIWIPGRVSSLTDFASNTAGIVFTLFFLRRFPLVSRVIRGNL